MVEKVIRQGMVAVLVSEGYGAGWSTWVDEEDRERALFDPGLVAILESVESDGYARYERMVKYAEEHYPDSFHGGLDGLEIEWVPVGVHFRINEYDGAESIEYRDSIKWEVA